MSKVVKTTRRNESEHPAEPIVGGVFMDERTDPLPWYHSALASRVPPQHRKARIAAYVVFGLGKAIRKGTKHVAVASGLAAKGKANAVRERRKQRREDPEWQYARRFGGAVFLCAPCREKFPSARRLNDHFVIEHLDEGWASRPAPIKRNPASRRTTAKPPTTRRPRTGKRAPGRAEALVRAYGKHADQIGARAMNETIHGRMIRAAGRHLSDQSPQALSDLRDDVLGLQKALGVLREGLEDYARTLRTAHGKRKPLAASVVNPYFGKTVAGLSDAETALLAFLFNFEAEFGPVIVAVNEDGHGGTEFLAG